MPILKAVFFFNFFSFSLIYALTLDSKNIDNSLIVYNSNLGLVHETRQVTLHENETQIVYKDVASSINTESVNISLPEEITLYSQQFRFDKLTRDKLLQAHIGKDIQAKVLKNSKEFEIISGTLLSSDRENSLIQLNDIIISVANDFIIFSNIPSELITKPSLVWNVKTNKDIDSKIDIDYLIDQISWKSNYVLNLNKETASLSGWINIDNRSGKAFKDTKLFLLAGDINRAKQYQENYTIMRTLAKVATSAPEVVHKPKNGYHFYSVPFKVNLSNNEQTQILFLNLSDVKYKWRYSVYLNHPNYFSGQIKKDVEQFIELDQLKVPLPKGIIRTYSKSSDTNILLGETHIDHTPKKNPLSLKIGKNFDLKVTQTLLRRDKRSTYHDNEIQYKLYNSSNEHKTILLYVPFSNSSGDKIKSSVAYKRTQGNFVEFEVSLSPQSTQEFKVQYKNKVQN